MVRTQRSNGDTNRPTYSGLMLNSDSPATTKGGLNIDSAGNPELWGVNGNILFELDSSGHMQLKTVSDSAQVRINSRTYTQTSGDTIGLQVTPNQAADTTGEVFGAQFKPRVANTFDAATCNGIGIDSELKGSGDGALSGDLRGINMYLGATGSGTIGGNVVCIRARAEVNINPTGRICFAHIVQHEGSQGWDGLLEFAEALGTHSMTTNSDKTGGAKSGTIKVYANGTLYHIQLYAN